jgi:hypothetical protein
MYISDHSRNTIVYFFYTKITFVYDFSKVVHTVMQNNTNFTTYILLRKPLSYLSWTLVFNKHENTYFVLMYPREYFAFIRFSQ